MSYQALARTWRPGTFDDLVGQEHVVRALVNALDDNRLHHAYLFTGTRGVGKTTIARILAKCLHCEQGVGSKPCGQCSACEEIDEGRFVDLLEVDAASRTKVDDTRELLDNVQYAPTRGRYKVYLIDEVHMLSGHSFNALLKTLEEPPPHVKFLLATTDPQKLPVTVLSRCLQFNLKRLPVKLIEQRLERVTGAEKIGTESAALTLLARAADGSMRDALSLLDQAAAYCQGSLSDAEVRAMLGTIDTAHAVRLLESLAAGDAPGLMTEVAALDERVPDYAAALDELAGLIQRIAISQVVGTAEDDERGDAETISGLADKISPEDLQLYYQIALIGKRDLHLAPSQRAGFEMVLLRMASFRPVTGVPPRPLGEQGVTKSRATAGTAAAPQRAVEAARPVSRPASAAGDTDWNTVVGQLDLRGGARQLAANCHLARREGTTLYLTLDAERQHLDTGALREKLRQALSAHYGEDVQVRVEAGRTEAETLVQRRDRKASEQQQQAKETIAADPNVAALKETFGATVDESSIRPR